MPSVEVRKLAARGALRAYWQGVYSHRGPLATPLIEPTIAVALAGEGVFLHRESVLDLVGFGQFNPPKVRVGARWRVRRALPEWTEMKNRPAVPGEDRDSWLRSDRARMSSGPSAPSGRLSR